jgi:hypothetical protein
VFGSTEVKSMKKALLGLGALAAVALLAPRAADAHVSVSVGLPGFVLGGPVYAPYGHVRHAYVPYHRTYVRHGYHHHRGRDRDCDRDRRSHRHHRRWH